MFIRDEIGFVKTNCDNGKVNKLGSYKEVTIYNGTANYNVDGQCIKTGDGSWYKD